MQVGVVGLGAIGGGVAGCLARGGHDLAVFDVAEAAWKKFEGQATICSSVSELAKGRDVVFIAVVDDTQVRDVVLGPVGALASLPTGSVIVVLSTVSVSTIRDLHKEATTRDVEVLDCGVTGGPGAASSGELVSLIGGSQRGFDHAKPAIDAFSALVLHMGPPGAGLTAKLARNLVQYASWFAAYEAQVLAEAGGIDLRKLAEAIRTSDKRIGGAATLMFRDTVTPWAPDADPGIVAAMRSASHLAHKDLRAAMDRAKELEVDLPLAELTEASCDLVFGFVAGSVGNIAVSDG